MRYTRLISARPRAAKTLIFPAFGAIVLGIFVGAVPWILQNPDAARAYADPTAKAVFVVVGALCALAFLTFAVVQIAVGLGLIASLYGRPTARGRVVLASPWGMLGHPEQRVTLEPGEITVRLVDEPPAFQVYSYGVQRLCLTQDATTLQIMSFVKYNATSRARLVNWLTTQGITPRFEGDQAVLPLQ
ncbi:hypothetical protein J4G33_06065 [Actinotalea sp. BY-33]|uniref:Uncharacterized protein n=1 Tax=Actinotalea soli TaxID=2819234 RepID=A0A939LPA9_9CELL|nr:hypothetical protein [Actinotalea soli]MBO1751364.1 hypothetical protein [Actinotalea soli]